MPPFRISSDFQPAGDQPLAIEQLVEGVKAGEPHLTLLGATGTGKTFTIAHVVAEVQRPTLVIAPNKSLGAQLATQEKDGFVDRLAASVVGAFVILGLAGAVLAVVAAVR